MPAPRHGGHHLPLNEVVFDFYDRLKSVSRGYASFDYHIEGYEEGDLSRCRSWSTAIRSMPVDDRQQAARRRPRPRHVRDAQGTDPRHMFVIPIQAAIGGKIIAAKR